MNHRNVYLGIALVALGGVMLLEWAGVLSFSFRDLLMVGVALVGGWMIVSGFEARPAGRGKVFWGVILVAVGGIAALQGTSLMEVSATLKPSLVIGVPGLAIALSVVHSPRAWHMLVPALALIGLSAGVGLVASGAMPDEILELVVLTYWPFAVILFGSALILNSWRRGAA